MSQESNGTKDDCRPSRKAICYGKQIWIDSSMKSTEFVTNKLRCSTIWILCYLSWDKLEWKRLGAVNNNNNHRNRLSRTQISSLISRHSSSLCDTNDICRIHNLSDATQHNFYRFFSILKQFKLIRNEQNAVLHNIQSSICTNSGSFRA